MTVLPCYETWITREDDRDSACVITALIYD